MCRKLAHLIFCAMALGLVLTNGAKAVDPDLVGWWRFDEGSGTIATDFSGKGNDGTLMGDSHYLAGKIGMAMEFDGVDDFVDVPHDESLMVGSEVTVMAWIHTSRHGGPGTEGWQGIIAKGNSVRSYSFYTESGGGLHFSTTSAGAYVGTVSSAQVALNEWVHVCGMVIGGEHQYYINGEDAGRSGSGIVLGEEDTANVVIGRTQEGANRSFLGMIDDPRIYMRGLTQEEVQNAMLGEGIPQAFGPSPADGAMHEDTWVTLSWKAGDFAVTHDVYLGDNFDDVDNGTGETFRGNQGSTFYVAGFPGFAYPDGLVPGQTYYWRIDEVNDAHPESPWKGEVWSFSIPPKTAYNPDPADGAESVDLDVKLSWTPGFGAKLHTVYFGDDYDVVNDATGGMPLGITSYNPGPLEEEKVYYWRVDEFDAVETHKGDIWCFTTPGAVGNPWPANGALEVTPTPILTWTAANSAASHQLYFGTDKEAVRTADTASSEYQGSQALGSESFDPGSLAWNTTFYWRVDEVDSQANTAKGPLWSFTTGGFLLVDDFESYTDDDVNGQAIWQHWIDGFGVPTNGAQVGYLMPPYAEQTIIHGGAQSMPLTYENTFPVTNSEATLTLTTTRDWTAEGVADLSLWFRGGGANAAEPLYVAISNSTGAPAVVAHEDPTAAQKSAWTEWEIPLQTFADQGINLTNVDKIAIGLGTGANMPAPGGSGTMYIDDIRLYRP
jgi:hypothetical protein